MLALLCAWLCLGLGGSVSVPREQQAPLADRAPIERLRERLQGRPREERARLERHLREFEELPRAARLRLLERARVLRAQERSLEEARERRTARAPLGPERGSEQWRAQLREGFRERGRELRARLPAELRRRLDQTPPELRRGEFERWVQRYEQGSLRALAVLRAELGLSERELARLERMPLADRLVVLRELLMKLRREREARGLPRR